MIVYDITDIDSFNSVEMWMAEVDKFASPSVNRLLIGNKVDLSAQRKIPFEKGAALAKEHKIKFLETSAKSTTNVIEAFKTMTEEVFGRMVKTPGMAKKEDKRDGKKTDSKKKDIESKHIMD